MSRLLLIKVLESKAKNVFYKRVLCYYIGLNAIMTVAQKATFLNEWLPMTNYSPLASFTAFINVEAVVVISFKYAEVSSFFVFTNELPTPTPTAPALIYSPTLFTEIPPVVMRGT